MPLAILYPYITNVFITNFLSMSKFISGENDTAVKVTDIANGRVFETVDKEHHILIH
jgi:hypothetical protein